jgi:hypothetical protein
MAARSSLRWTFRHPRVCPNDRSVARKSSAAAASRSRSSFFVFLTAANWTCGSTRRRSHEPREPTMAIAPASSTRAATSSEITKVPAVLRKKLLGSRPPPPEPAVPAAVNVLLAVPSPGAATETVRVWPEAAFVRYSICQVRRSSEAIAA